MNRFLIVFLVISALISSGYINQDQFNDRAENIAHQIERYIKNETQLSLFCLGSACPNDLERIIVWFNAPYPSNIDHARNLFVYVSENLLYKINGDKEIRPYLHDYPYTIKNLEIQLVFAPDSEDSITNVINQEDKVIYCRKDPSLNSFVAVFSEPYVEAFQKSQRSGK